MRRNLNKAYEITDAKIQFVSLVDKAANKHSFLIKKADDKQATFSTYGRIVKADENNHYVTGIVYEPMTEDSHGNFMTEEEITKAAYWFAKNGDKVDIQHSFEPIEGATVVETWIAKSDFEIDDESIKKGTWLMTMEVSDEGVWDAIEKGDITGFSMGGIGNYSEEDVNLDSVSKKDTNDKKSLLKQLAKALGLNVEKGEVSDLFEKKSKGSLFWNAYEALSSCLCKYDYHNDEHIYVDNEDEIREALEDFNSIVTEILTSKSIAKTIQADRPVEKAGKKMSGKNKETLQGIYDTLGTFLAEFDEKVDDPDEVEPKENADAEKNKSKEEKEVTKQEVEEIVAKSVSEAIAKAEEDAKTKEDDVKKTEEITQETIEKMVEEAIEKSTKPEPETVTVEQVQEMIAKAVGDAMEPVLKSKGLPSNLNDSTSAVKKDAEHYLHGIL